MSKSDVEALVDKLGELGARLTLDDRNITFTLGGRHAIMLLERGAEVTIADLNGVDVDTMRRIKAWEGQCTGKNARGHRCGRRSDWPHVFDGLLAPYGDFRFGWHDRCEHHRDSTAPKCMSIIVA